MKRAVVAEFNSITALMAFKQAKQLTNCVIVDNMLHCYLSDSDIDQLLMYGGKIVKDTSALYEEAGEVTKDLAHKAADMH